MNIKQFVEQSEREFMDKFVTTDGFGIPHPDSLAMQIKSFTSSKLRELIGEVRREIIEWVSTNESCNKLDADMVERYVNSLLDEAGDK